MASTRLGGHVNKAELIDVISERLGDRRAATQAVEHVTDAIMRAVSQGEKVAITGFGVFEKKSRGARTGRNPATGESVQIAETSVPRFRAGGIFKEVVSGARELAAVAAVTAANAAESTADALGSGRKRTAAATVTGGRTTATKKTARKRAKKTTKKAGARKAGARKTTRKAGARKTTRKAG